MLYFLIQKCLSLQYHQNIFERGIVPYYACRTLIYPLGLARISKTYTTLFHFLFHKLALYIAHRSQRLVWQKPLQIPQRGRITVRLVPPNKNTECRHAPQALEDQSYEDRRMFDFLGVFWNIGNTPVLPHPQAGTVTRY